MSENRFVDNGDGTVNDTLTQLMWMQKDSYLDLLRFVTHKGSLKYMGQKKTKKLLPDIRIGVYLTNARHTLFMIWI